MNECFWKTEQRRNRAELQPYVSKDSTDWHPKEEYMFLLHLPMDVGNYEQ
jgi:hypothetical protein